MSEDVIIDHNEAWSLAHMRMEESNLARAYIELRKVARAVVDGEDVGRLWLIVKAND